MFTKKEVSETKSVVVCLASIYWAFKLSERDFIDFSNFESNVINISQSSHKSLKLFKFDDTA